MKRKSVLMEKIHLICKKVYLLTLRFNQIYQFSIGEQLRRAVLSIPLNITEGNARTSNKEKKQFFNIAYSSLKEVKYLLYFCLEINLIDKKDYEEIFFEFDEIGKLLYGLIKKFKDN
ncbi:MAG: four helix bundle protein [Patescibacteria group bacterium]|nr:four helix bundle protein [Patescibacteria group bacterium]